MLIMIFFFWGRYCCWTMLHEILQIYLLNLKSNIKYDDLISKYQALLLAPNMWTYAILISNVDWYNWFQKLSTITDMKNQYSIRITNDVICLKHKNLLRIFAFVISNYSVDIMYNYLFPLLIPIISAADILRY